MARELTLTRSQAKLVKLYREKIFGESVKIEDLHYATEDELSKGRQLSYWIEQAEQARELEARDEYRKMMMQNKRYRKALNRIMNIDVYFQDIPFDAEQALKLIDIEACKALEE